MDDNFDKINYLKKALYNSEKMINDLDNEIKDLSAQKTLLKENEKLRQTHKQNQLEISKTKNKLNDYDYQNKINHKTISELKEENMKIKSGSIINQNEDQKIKNVDNLINIVKEKYPDFKIIKTSEIIQLNNEIFQENDINDFEDEGNIFNNGNEEDEEIINKLANLIQDREEAERVYRQYGKEQICQIFKFDLKKDKKKEEKESFKENNKNIINFINNYNNNNKSSYMEELKVKKIQYEELFVYLKKLCKEFHDDLEQANLLIENYNNFVEEVAIQFMLLSEGNMAMEEMDQITINIDDIEKFDFLDNQTGKIFSCLQRLESIYFAAKENFGLNVEQLLNKINIYLKSLNKNKYQNDAKKQYIIMLQLDENIKELLKICNVFERKMEIFYNENKRASKEVIIFKNKISKEKENKNMNQLNRLFNLVNSNNNNDNEDNKLAQSFLIEYKNPKNKDKFDDINEDLMEKYINEPKLIRKNWIEKCYIYDDYDVHDIVYDIKAVSNDNKLIFNSCSFAFDYNKNIKIKYLTVNDIPVPHTKKLNSIEFKIKLHPSQTAKIHIIYEESKDLSKLTKGEIEKRKIYREGKYGLKSTLSGQKAKFSLILKGNFVIVNFSEYFLIKNKENSKTTEYFWEGIVPYNGKITNIIFSKSEATWSFSAKSKFLFDKKLNCKTFIFLNKAKFIGGNNEIIELNTYSPQTEDIYLDEEKMNYIITYNNIVKEVEFNINGIFKNKCKGEYHFEITDKDFEDNIQEYFKIYKTQLKKIAEEIIKEFDSNNTNKDFEFLDYMKIGLWVHKNIKYDLNFVGNDELNPLDIYNRKAGVSHHFTQLTNALLFSLGYKVVYIMGYLSKNNNEFNQDSYHSWSIIQINNKWYPFDSTLGIFSGKLPVSHIFDTYYYNILLYATEGLKMEKNIVSGKLIN